MKIMYRADKRDFNLGDIIVTAGEFMIKNPEGALAIEAVFEKARPSHLPRRDSALYLFETLEAAKYYWSKMIGGKLYEVSPIVIGETHRGDMCHVNEAFASRNVSALVNESANKYWAGTMTTNPVVEVLVHSAKVVAVISKDDTERRDYFKSQVMMLTI